MVKKGGDRRLKRMKAPAFWPIPRKEHLWTGKPSPGPHESSQCLTLLNVVREMLGLAKTYKEVRIILSDGKVKVDGEARGDMKFPIGTMDIVEIPDTSSSYRVLPSGKGLILHSIDQEETSFKLCRIEDKRSLRGAMFQLNLHDGRNIVVSDGLDEEQPYPVSTLKTYDVLKLTVPGQEMLDHLSFKVGSYAMIMKGKNAGRHGRVIEIDRGQGLRPKMVTLQDTAGNHLQTILAYIFLLGEEEPWISLPEVS